VAVFDGWFGLQDWWSDTFGNNQRAKLTGADAHRVDALTAGLGRPISPDSAMRVATVWACVRLLSETIGGLPLGVYTKDAKGQRSAAQDHALYRLLHESPNADQTAAEWVEALVVCLCLWGNFFAEITRNGVGQVSSLQIMLPDRVTLRRDPSGARRYRYIDLFGASRDLSEDQVFHVRGFGVGGDLGLSPIGYARRTLAVSLAADDAASNAVTNGIRPAGFLAEPAGGKSTSDQRKEMRRLVLDPVMGPAGAGGGTVIPAGWTWTAANGLPPEDLQLLETRAFHIEELCRWFRVPPFMIGHTEKSTSWGTGLEQQMIGFLTFSLNPYLIRIEQAVRKQLCTPADRAEGVYAEFNLEGLLRADSAGRAALYGMQAQNGIATRNEIRRRENLPDMEGGDTLTVQSNLVPLEKLGEAPPTETPAGFGHLPPPVKKPTDNGSSGAPAQAA
jgi:HK97 family phage portal protein